MKAATNKTLIDNLAALLRTAEDTPENLALWRIVHSSVAPDFAANWTPADVERIAALIPAAAEAAPEAAAYFAGEVEALRWLMRDDDKADPATYSDF